MSTISVRMVLIVFLGVYFWLAQAVASWVYEQQPNPTTVTTAM